MRIGIFTLTEQRDKVVDNLLAEHLRNMGHEVHVHNYIMAIRQSIPYFKFDLVVLPMVGAQFKYDVAQKCHEWGIKVVIRRGEAGASRESFEKMSSDRQTIILGNWDYAPYVDMELVWGSEFADLLADKTNMPRNKIRTCGAFAFDSYKELDRRPHDGKTVLWATGFSAADSQVEYCECGLPEKSEFHEVLYKTHRSERDKWITAMRRMKAKYPDWRFLLKVRPGEKTTEYREKVGDVVEVLDQRAHAPDVLPVCDLVIHSGSTLAIEAHLLGIPTIGYRNINPDPMVSDLSPQIDNYSSMEFYANTCIEGGSNLDTRALEKLEDHLYGRIDGNATLRAARYIQNEVILNPNFHDTFKVVPDQWPREPKYWDDQDHIHLKPTNGCLSWLCPCCQNGYYVDKYQSMAKCPYCGMTIMQCNTAKPATSSFRGRPSGRPPVGDKG